MKVLSKVLWAIDLNSDHNVSINKMKSVSEQFGNELILLHVLPSHIKGEQSQNKIAKSIQFEIENKIVERLKLSDDLIVKIRVEIGNIAETVNKVAKEEKVNLVVLNKGKTATLGQNGLNIIRKLQKPVAVLPKSSPPGNKKHIVCPVDNSEPSAVALKAAILHARKINAKLSVISVYKPITITSPRLMKAGLNEENERKFQLKTFKQELKEFLKDFDFLNVDAEALVLEGNADEEILNYSKTAGVLYVGNSGKGPFQRAFMGSVSEKVIREAKCSVVLVKKEDVFKLQITPGLHDVEKHYNRANELRKMGFLQEAINQYETALEINNLHFPSIDALTDVYAVLGNEAQSEYYTELGDAIRRNILHKKIEYEIRQQYKTVS